MGGGGVGGAEQDRVVVMEVKVEQEGQRTVTLSKATWLFEDGLLFRFFDFARHQRCLFWAEYMFVCVCVCACVAFFLQVHSSCSFLLKVFSFPFFFLPCSFKFGFYRLA